jgi:hypothetical protein
MVIVCRETLMHKSIAGNWMVNAPLHDGGNQRARSTTLLDTRSAEFDGLGQFLVIQERSVWMADGRTRVLGDNDLRSK